MGRREDLTISSATRWSSNAELLLALRGKQRGGVARLADLAQHRDDERRGDKLLGGLADLGRASTLGAFEEALEPLGLIDAEGRSAESMTERSFVRMEVEPRFIR